MKSTHSGTCQICGCVQKLPNGKLAKHGYTKRWGFFTGTCTGSGEFPYEISCQKVIESISTAEKVKNTYIAKAFELSQPEQIPDEKIEFLWDFKVKGLWGDKKTTKATFIHDKGSWFIAPTENSDLVRIYAVSVGIYGKTKLELWNSYREREAKKALREVANLKEYITFQTERVKEWKPSALIPNN